MAKARINMMTEIDGITEVNNNSHLNLKRKFGKSQAEKIDQNRKLCRASQTIKKSKSSKSRYEQLISGLETKLNEKAQQLSSSEKKIKNLERSRQAMLAKSAKLKAKVNDEVRRLSEAKARIETSERTIAKSEAEIAEKRRQLAEAKQIIESRLICSVCMDEDANRMWSTCHHVSTCEQCATELLYQDKTNLSKGVACPKCRTLGFPLEVFI